MLYEDTNGEEMVWRQYYQIVSGGSISAVQVLSDWFATIVEEILDIWPANTNSTQYQIINGMDNGDNYELAQTDAGQNGSSAYLPSMASLALRQPRSSPGQRHAYHHLGGMTNQLAAGSGTWDGTVITLINALIANLDNPISVDAIANIVPVQLTGGFKLGVEPTVARILSGGWQMCLFPVPLRRRVQYDWA
jgi:hypothetical protein